MRNLLASCQMITVIGTSTIGTLINSGIQNQNHPTTTTTQEKTIQVAKQQATASAVDKLIKIPDLNWENIENHYQTILQENLPNKSLTILNANQNMWKNQLQQSPFAGINKVIIGCPFVTVYINENLLNFIMQSIINYKHGEVETITETIVAVLLTVGFKAGAIVLGAIGAILYSYFEVIASVDEGAGVGFYLLFGLVLSGVWAQ